ncbi:carbohydrate ABC transporter permease [Fodinisporobacter ferrooxydans]|uniref:Carbohydrate ABC transporter permease n=1 Tax=Fodinisporobacter ferrooxydans TaxID=2901836 RepID=A0ABY4CKQ2_9BACL|nr:carbohydrate ABC transporter permease [Alicyclobacillaceae bacterium MYW30-H2]
MKQVWKTGLTVLTYGLAIAYFFPIFLMFITGFKTERDAFHMPPTLFFHPTLVNYENVFNSGIAAFMGNSLIAAFGSTIVSLLLGAPVAYALAIYKPKKGDDIFFWFISTKILPPVGVIIPIYLLFKNLGLLDSLTGLILLYTGMNTPTVVWMMRSFFSDIPYEVIEACQVDGATGLQAVFRVIIPLVKPGLISTGLLCMVFAWNEFFLAVNISYTNSATLPVLVSSFMTSEGLFWAKLSAVSTVAVLPALILGWFTQKQLVRGLTMGAVKG